MQLWLTFAVSAYLCAAVSTSIDKFFMNKKKNDPLTTGAFKMFFDGFLLLIVGLIFFNLSFSLNALLWSLLVGFLYALLSYGYFTILKLRNVGTVIPFYDSFLILSVFVGSILILNERPSLLNYIGIPLILIGVYLVLSEKFKLPKADKAIFIVLSMVIIGTIYSLLVKTLLTDIEPINLVVPMYFSTTLFLSIFLLFRKPRRAINLKSSKIFISAFFGAMSVFLLYTALSFGNASQVYPIAGLSSVTIFLIASIFLKEKFYLHKLIAVLMVFFGIYFVSL
jgi:uncharacterized membrane protein